MERVLTAALPSIRRRFLAIYLRDRLAAGVIEVQMARRTLRSNGNGPWAAPLRRVLEDVRSDHQDLRSAARALGIRGSWLKEAGARVAERAGRLKLNGRLTGYSP